MSFLVTLYSVSWLLIYNIQEHTGRRVTYVVSRKVLLEVCSVFLPLLENIAD